MYTGKLFTKPPETAKDYITKRSENSILLSVVRVSNSPQTSALSFSHELKKSETTINKNQPTNPTPSSLNQLIQVF